MLPSEGGSSNVQCAVQCTVQTLGAPPLSVHCTLPSAQDVIHVTLSTLLIGQSHSSLASDWLLLSLC
mgnify:CR=1 FL=1